MIAADRKSHWQTVYSTRAETDVSWYQAEPRLSLELIEAIAPARGSRIIDVGGGASVLVDRLLDLSFEEIAVLDISESALGKARARLGKRAERVRWVVADVTEAPELGSFDVWHDRAVFHFLTDPDERRSYAELAKKTVPEGGHLVIATFADDGPKRCSDLDVCRYNARSLASELGQGFSLVREASETHTSPWGSSQPFFYGVFRRQ
jgi:SAM-dependent methyltransferase